jgi:DUF917 family protein
LHTRKNKGAGKKMDLKKDDLKSLAHGACFLGCGGGGPLIATLKILEAFPDSASVACVPLEIALQDERGLTAVVAFIGSPNAADQLKYPLPDAIAAFKNLNEKVKTKYGREITYLVPAEVGAGNTIVPFIVACEVNKEREEKIKVIDADGSGRAVPQVTLSTFAANGLSCNPTVLSRSKEKVQESLAERVIPHVTLFTSSAYGLRYDPVFSSTDEKSYSVSLEIDSAADVEDLARIAISNDIFDQCAGLAMWPMDSEQLKQADPVEGTLRKALGLGKLLRGPGPNDLDLLGRQVFVGTLVDIQTSTSGGFDHGLGKLENEETTFFIYIQNENIIGWCSDQSEPKTMAPDLICYLAEEYEQPEGCPEPIRVFSNAAQDWKCFQNKKVTVIGRPCDEKLRQGTLGENFHQLRIALGYPGPYVPFEGTEMRNMVGGKP